MPKLTQRQMDLFRIAGQRILADHAAGRRIAPEALADARRWASYPRLADPLTSGEPVPDDQLPPPLRGGALGAF